MPAGTVVLPAGEPPPQKSTTLTSSLHSGIVLLHVSGVVDRLLNSQEANEGLAFCRCEKGKFFGSGDLV